MSKREEVESNRVLLLKNMDLIMDFARRDSNLDGAVALLCAACVAIAAGEEDELIMVVKPYMDRTTQQYLPDLWQQIQAMNNAGNN